MSAPLTPEQRETLTAMADEESMLAGAANDGGPTQRRRLARCAALRAALSQPARACGACKHFRPWFPDGKSMNGHPDRRGDCTHRSYLGRRNGQSPDDGCIKGWSARDTETTP